MSNEPIKIKLDKEWRDRVDAAVEVVGRIADGMGRIADALEKIAEYKRRDYL